MNYGYPVYEDEDDYDYKPAQVKYVQEKTDDDDDFDPVKEFYKPKPNETEDERNARLSRRYVKPSEVDYDGMNKANNRNEISQRTLDSLKKIKKPHIPKEFDTNFNVEKNADTPQMMDTWFRIKDEYWDIALTLKEGGYSFEQIQEKLGDKAFNWID